MDGPLRLVEWVGVVEGVGVGVGGGGGGGGGGYLFVFVFVLKGISDPETTLLLVVPAEEPDSERFYTLKVRTVGCELLFSYD